MHRAFSILIFNSKGELLVQKRAKNKYHSRGLWANSCCGHQKENERLVEAAHRRLIEEMGFDCALKEIFSFSYRVKFANGLIENEIDHVFVGKYDDRIESNKEEIEDYKWVSLDELKKDVKKNPKKYAYWFKLILRIFNFNK